jgi:hypothetical protein
MDILAALTLLTIVTSRPTATGNIMRRQEGN